MKKSIFRQKTFRKLYNLEYITIEDEGITIFDPDHNKNIKTSIQCNINYNDEIDDKEIFVCDLSLPLMKKGEQFYIEELKMLVSIENVYRTSSDSICYYIKPKLIEDDKTKQSLIEAKKILGEKLNEIGVNITRLKNLENIVDKQYFRISNLESIDKEIKDTIWYKIGHKLKLI